MRCSAPSSKRTIYGSFRVSAAEPPHRISDIPPLAPRDDATDGVGGLDVGGEIHARGRTTAVLAVEEANNPRAILSALLAARPFEGSRWGRLSLFAVIRTSAAGQQCCECNHAWESVSLESPDKMMVLANLGSLTNQTNN